MREERTAMSTWDAVLAAVSVPAWLVAFHVANEIGMVSDHLCLRNPLTDMIEYEYDGCDLSWELASLTSTTLVLVVPVCWLAALVLPRRLAGTRRASLRVAAALLAGIVLIGLAVLFSL
ncbi:hypothetical protein [Microtetraspora fusca]|uniref:hypothetical protein n=1 Tax=Microtetraspora fusca TaxID=1997 RepID=UPI000AC56F94|nr:hypothetical protein [Microtetraspora fusca]